MPALHQEQFLRSPLRAGEPVRYWQLGDIQSKRYDVADAPMQGEMDPFFFLTKHKNFIPHEYPCRTSFAAEHRDRRPIVLEVAAPSRWWLPFKSPRVDLSGFWFRPTHIASRAVTNLDAAAAGTARLRLGTCGGAVLHVNGEEAGWMAPYTRNLEAKAEFEIRLRAGINSIAIYFDDLAERDVRFFFQLDYLSGPQVEVAVSTPIDGGLAAQLEAVLEGLRFDKTAYLGGDVTILFPAGLPCAVDIRVDVEGAASSLDFHVPEGAASLNLGPSTRQPADFRHFGITFSTFGFVASRTLGVEICHVERQGTAPRTLLGRVDEALSEVAEFAAPDTVRALARLAIGKGGAETDAMIAAKLPAIEDCHDCADFALVPLLWARAVWGADIDPDLRTRIDRAILGYRYWMDEPGNDVQWYFSENHALLFHTAAYLAGSLLPDATFRRSQRQGREQAKVGAERVRDWLMHFETWEMAEFNSAPYFPIDLKGLTTLAALAPDADIRARAAKGVMRLAEIVARSAHHGMITGAQGRSYEHTLAAGRSLELSAIARLLWGKGWYGHHVHVLPLLAVLIRDHGMIVPETLGAIADWQSRGAQEWTFAQGANRFASLYHYKTHDYALASAAHYRWNAWGYQETVLHLRLGTRPEAAIWINHPGEIIQFGAARPSYWGGSGTLPRVHQYRGLAILDFSLHADQPDFTHAWFPRAAFDTARVVGNIAVAGSGDGLVLLKGSADFEIAADGPSAEAEIRLPGRKAQWIVRVSDTATEGGIDGLERFAALEIATGANDSFIVDDPDYGRVVFHNDGIVEAEGRSLDPAQWTIAGEARILAVNGA
ncbi:MAG TPA: hypothetical protein VGM83_14770 [Devosiaceae bacterium]|jgi:hypothetical protein